MKKGLIRAVVMLLLAAFMLLTVACGGANSNADNGTSSQTETLLLPPGNDEQSPSTNDWGDASGIKNVILVIGDGMGLEHITAGEMYEGKNYAFTDWQKVSVNTDSVETNGKGAVLTDSAAAGTALATGCLTVNGYVGKDYAGRNVRTILDGAKENGKATGIVTTDALHGATPAAFSAHSLSRTDADGIVMSQLTSGVDLLCGSTHSVCTNRKNSIVSAGYAYCDDFSAIDGTLSAERVYWQLNMGGVDAPVTLADATEKALAFLERDEDGFVLMIEQAHVDKYSHSNDFRGVAESVRSLNDTVEAILEWLGDRTDTAILVTADHETGGLSVSYTSRLSQSFWAENVKIYYSFSSVEHTNHKVGLFVYGVKVDFSNYSYSSRHVLKNIDVYSIMQDVLNNALS